ncbi:MAG: hypothetical protein AB1730_11415 [Myxococcota bacterium]
MRAMRVLAAGLVVTAGLCLVSALVMPRVVHMHPEPRERECRVLLRGVYSGQQALRADRGRYSTRIGDIGFQPEYGNRYLYLLTPDGRIAERRDGGAALGLDLGANGVGPDTSRTQETTATLRAKLPASIAAELGTYGDCDAGTCGFTAACVGNVDGDETPDVWTVSTEETVDVDGVRVAPGQPARRVNDRAD